MLKNRKFQIVSLVLGTLFIADQSYAYAMECHSWYYHIGALLLEMCAIRHPLGHYGLFNWSQPVTQYASVLSAIEWSTIAAMIALFVWREKVNVLVRWRPFQIFSLTVIVLLVVTVSAYAKEPSEYTVWEVMQIIWEMCPIRHPFGHHGFFSWATPADGSTVSSQMQWMALVGASLASVVLFRRRK
jgi:hypothetical protein